MKKLNKRKVLYFAYGSNMSLVRITERLGNVKRVCSYVLEGYELVFDYGNSACSFANVKRKEGGEVEGVIYEMELWQLQLLDGYEGAIGNFSEFFYQRQYIMYGSRKLHFYISENRREEFAKPLSPRYYNYLLQGCIENNLVNYLAFLENLDKSKSGLRKKRKVNERKER